MTNNFYNLRCPQGFKEFSRLVVNTTFVSDFYEENFKSNNSNNHCKQDRPIKNKIRTGMSAEKKNMYAYIFIYRNMYAYICLV